MTAGPAERKADEILKSAPHHPSLSGISEL